MSIKTTKQKLIRQLEDLTEYLKTLKYYIGECDSPLENASARAATIRGDADEISEVHYSSDVAELRNVLSDVSCVMSNLENNLDNLLDVCRDFRKVGNLILILEEQIRKLSSPIIISK